MKNCWCKGQKRGRPSIPAGMSRAVSFVAFAALTSASLAACTPTVATHGHTLDEAQIAQIEPGRSARTDVERLLGSPSAQSSFDDKTWYYVSQRTETASFYQEKLVAQDVIAVTFNEQDVVAEINRHGMDQSAQVDPVERVTPTAGEAPSVFEQIIGNIGRFGSSAGSGASSTSTGGS